MNDLTFLTTKEVADLLRVKERKVYDLAAADEIPHRRITGKILFPRAELLAWIDGNGAVRAPDRPGVLTGSHDPLLEWALLESQAELATLINGSFDGLNLFADGGAAMTGLHIPEAAGWNVRTITSRGVHNCVLVAWAVRSRGLILSRNAGDTVASFADLRGKRVVHRQSGAGAAALFDSLMTENAMSYDELCPVAGTARTEHDAASAIVAGEAEAALGIEAMARQFNLPFVPLLQERFDLLIDRKFYFEERFQRLLRFLQSDAFRLKGAALGGYDLSETGQVRWVSP